MSLPFSLQVGLAALVGAGLFVAFLSPQTAADLVSQQPLVGGIGQCIIKGNISVNSGERIYHVPGQYRYSDTIIRPEWGERWFCSEQEARAAGWRKAGH